MRFEYADSRMPVAMIGEGVIYYLTYDQVGSLRVVADASGHVVKRIDYDSFGNIIDDTNQTYEVPFGFAGGQYDKDTGLLRFGFRDYDPDTGRWAAKDPIFFAGNDTDLYGYCLNDPVSLVDPLGLWSFWFGGSSIIATPSDGSNIGGGFAFDSNNGGAGLYGTSGTSEGMGASVGAEVGIYTGSMAGKTTILTVGIGNYSLGLVTGEKWWEIGLVAAYSVGLPLEASISHNNTVFIPTGSQLEDSPLSPCN